MELHDAIEHSWKVELEAIWHSIPFLNVSETLSDANSGDSEDKRSDEGIEIKDLEEDSEFSHTT